PAAKAALFEHLARTAKAVRFHSGLSRVGKLARFQTVLHQLVNAVRFHGSLRGVAKVVCFPAGLSGGAAQKRSPGRKSGVRSETKTQPQRGERGLSPSHLNPAARTSVEAQGFSPAKIRPSLTWALAL